MNIADIIIIIIILMGAIIGFKNGFTKQLFSFVGFIIVVVLSFILKNPLSALMFEYLPFFKFGGIFKGVTVLNILLYEVISFVIVFSVLSIVYKIILKITGLFERILKATIILSIPSKLLGMVVGALEYFIVVFVILYIVSLPFFNIDFIRESKLRNKILNNTPILSDLIDESIIVLDDISKLKNDYESNMSANDFNLKSLDILMKYKLTTVESIDKLIENNKLSIENVDSVLNNYR